MGGAVNACARGCTTRDHATSCLCTSECPEHPSHCKGCLPRAAIVGHYCQRCADKFRDNLYELPQLVALVAQSPGGKLTQHQGTGDTSRRPTKVDQQSPSPAWDTADEVIQWAASWAWVIAGRPGYDPSRYNTAGIPVRELTRSISHITNRLTQALSDDYHAELYDEAATLHKRLTHATGSDELTHRLKKPCPSCDQRTLVREDGAGQIECRNRDCARVWTEDQYDNFVYVVAS